MEIEVVILAAGYSSRADGFKMSFKLDGKPVLHRVIEVFHKICARIFVVSGHRAEEIEKLAAGYKNVRVVYNPRYDDGMFSSVQAGAACVQAARFFFTPGDYPLIGPDVCRKLLAVRSEVVIPTFGGRKGHPVLLDGALAPEIVREPPDSNLKRFLQRKTCQLTEVGDAGILIDLDTQEDYAALRRMAEARAVSPQEKTVCGTDHKEER